MPFVEGRIAGLVVALEPTHPCVPLPASTSKWDKIEHRMFCHITQNWRGTLKVAQKLALSRQAVHKHVQRLVEEGVLSEAGQTRNKSYQLVPQMNWRKKYPINGKISEDQVWRGDVAPVLGSLPENVMGIWQYGFLPCLTPELLWLVIVT